GTTPLDTITYDGFGKVTNETSTTNNDRFKFTGREYDSETGLQYNRARYYDSATGKWISQDPMGFDAHDGNLYRYVRNAPTRYTDPSGLVGNGAFDHGTVSFTKYDTVKTMQDVYGFRTEDGPPASLTSVLTHFNIPCDFSQDVIVPQKIASGA